MAATGKLRTNRRYVRYRTARAISLFGSQLSWIAYPLLVLSLGGTTSQAGLVASCSLVTRAVFRLPGGHIADRFDRRLLMLGADVVAFVAVGSIPLAAAWHALTYPQLLGVAVIEGVASAVFGPSATGMLRQLVSGEHLTRALGQTQSFNAVITLAGPALGGALYGLGRMLPFTFDALSYGMSAVLLLGLAVARRPSSGATDQRATAGLRWLWHRPRVMRVLAFIGVLNLVGTSTSVVVVVSLHERGVPSAAIGAVMACAGAGTLLGAMFARQITERLRPVPLCLTIGALWSLGFAAFAVAPSPWVMGPVLVLLLMGVPAGGVMLAAITLGEAPHDLLGRVSSAEQVVTSSLGTAGPVLGGVLLQALGIGPAWLILAGLCVLATAFLFTLPLVARWRTAARPARAAAEAPGVPAEGGGAA